MIFSRVYITDSGYEIFGDAIISDNPLTGEIERYNVEWGDVKVSRYDLSNVDRAYINTLTASSEVFNESNLTGDGYVSGVVRTPNESTVYDPPVYTTITVSSTVTNIHYNGTARTLGIWARLNHGSEVSDEWKLVVVAAANDTDVNQGDNVIPQSGQETYSSMVDCHIRISDNYTESTIQGADSWYATASNFQKLLNRSVTKYKDGSSALNPVGESQTIYGIKTFKDETHCDATLRTKKIVASDDITATGKTVTADTFKGTLGNSSTLCNVWASNIYFGNTTSAVPYIKKDSNNLLIAGSVVPGTNTYNIGSANVRWNTVYATTFNGTSFTGTADTATNLTNKPVVTWTNASKSGTTITDASIKVKAGEKESDAKTVTTVKQAYIPYIDTTSSSNSYPLVFTTSITSGFKSLYTDTANTLYYNPSSNTLTCTSFSGSLSGNATSASHASNLTYISGSSYTTKLSATNSQITAYSSIIPSTSNTIDLGSTSKVWKTIYAGAGDSVSNGYLIIGNCYSETGTYFPAIVPSQSGKAYLGFYDQYFATIFTDQLGSELKYVTKTYTDSLYCNNFYNSRAALASELVNILLYGGGSSSVGQLRLLAYWRNNGDIANNSYMLERNEISGSYLYSCTIKSDSTDGNISSGNRTYEDWDPDLWVYTPSPLGYGTWSILNLSPLWKGSSDYVTTGQKTSGKYLWLVLALRIG